MSYMALYRKWRPTTFEDVKGQDHIVQTLKNQITSGRIGHAYLFCGTRGTGKTSIAKIFARAVNCEHPVDGSPCGECQTCKNRKYVDGSNEANVSFKNAAHISPEAASSAVRAHEGQHVSNAYHKAATQNGEVVSASVRVQTSVCPECGRSYISGGVTDTQIRYYNESNPYQQDLKQTDGIKLRGANVDEIG